MNELSLFSGAGGGLLGTKLLGFRHIGYVEWNEYCQQIIAQRIKDGVFDKAPIFTDVRKFVQSGIAREYRGFTDVVTAGFPCQPFSVAGKRKSSDDERNMWPATMEIIRQVRPANVLLENVSGLLSANETYCQNCGDSNWQFCELREKSICGTCEVTMDGNATRPFYYFGEILRDLAESGYDARWCVLGADDLGAIHRRKRLWIYAWDTKSKHSVISKSRITKHKEQQKSKSGNPNQQIITADSNSNGSGAKSNTSRSGCVSGIRDSETEVQRSEQEMDSSNAAAGSNKDIDVTNTDHAEAERQQSDSGKILCNSETKLNNKVFSGKQVHDSNDRSKRGHGVREKEIQGKPALPWGENIGSVEELRNRSDIPEPLFRGVDDGLADRTHRLTAIGNGQVPSVVATAWRVLTNDK